MVHHEDRIVLHIPAGLVTEPLMYRLVKDFDVTVNILKAEVVENDDGLMVLGMQGVGTSISAAKKFLTDQGVRLQSLNRDILVDWDRCTDCGACVGQCPSAAMYLSDEYELQFDPEKCIACGHCVAACTLGAIEVKFEE